MPTSVLQPRRTKPCRANANAGQAASALHVMPILQVYQAKLLKSLDESGPDPEVFKELRRATDLALRTTKMTARAIGRSMGNLVVLDRHLWLTLTELEDTENMALLDAPVDPSGLFRVAVETFTETSAETIQGHQPLPA
ncbi:guanylate cyclase 2G-like protein [Labeo rohita]|uniref:Guanylate cyclase 2G-like protein n=1 Tax=Labeo rohita TaxID=84645 RepID=A0A498P3X0_LABRO|nr:guanylate cyclase 2G-like protein [Labeo rohita]